MFRLGVLAGVLWVGGAAAQEPLPPPPPTPGPGTCLPQCRAGFVCVGNVCVSACNPPCAAGETCTNDGQCLPPQRVYVPVPAAPEPEPVVVEEEAPRRSRTAKAFIAVHSDVLGAAQLGPTLTFEMGTMFSGLIRGRWLQAGLLTHFVAGNLLQNAIARGFSVAAGARFYSSGKGNLRGFYAGLAAEVISTSVVRLREDNGSGNGLAYEGIHVMPTIDSGYRWAFGNFLLGVGGTAGAALPVYLKRTPVGCTEGCLVLPSNAAQRLPVPYAGITLDVGAVF